MKAFADKRFLATEMLNSVFDDFNPLQVLVFICLQHKSFENTEGKGEIAHNEQFLLFLQHFSPFGELSAIVIKF